MFAKQGNTFGQNNTKPDSQAAKDEKVCSEGHTTQYLSTRIEAAEKILSFEERLK